MKSSRHIRRIRSKSGSTAFNKEAGAKGRRMTFCASFFSFHNCRWEVKHPARCANSKQCMFHGFNVVSGSDFTIPKKKQFPVFFAKKEGPKSEQLPNFGPIFFGLRAAYSTLAARCAKRLEAAAAIAPTMSSKNVLHFPVDLSFNFFKMPGFCLSTYP